MEASFNQWIMEGKDLPVLSGTVASILSLTQGERSCTDQVAEVIKRDVSLSAATLRIANSPAFGLIRKVSSIDQAVVMLGFNALRNIALGVSVLNLLPPDGKGFLSQTWKRSLVTAIAARELSRLGGYRRIENAFTAGLLHDIGLIALYKYDNNKALNLAALTEKEGRVSIEEERRCSGIDHVEAGRLLSERWRLPEEIVSAIMSHHEEPKNGKPEDGKLGQIAYLGSLVGDVFFFGKKRESIQKFQEGAERLMNVPEDDSELLLQNMHQQLTEIATLFNIGVGGETSYEAMIRKANEEIVNVTVSNEAIKYHLSQAFEREKKLAAQLEEANRKLKIMATLDGLTGLYNRQSFDEILSKEWSRSDRHGQPLSLIMVDIDNFKNVNDTYGHQAGDLAIREIAMALKKTVRKCDYVSRYGGEEFAVILPQTELPNAFLTAERLRSAVQTHAFSLKKNGNLRLTVSCGVATAHPKGDAKPEALIDEADSALYKAKTTGRNQVFPSPGEGDVPFMCRGAG